MKYTFEDLKRINEEKILSLEKTTNQKELDIQLAIKDILKNKNCFFNMKAATAIDILTNLIEKDNIKETYLELINAQNFRNNNIIT